MNKAVSDYMREMQARSAKSRWSGLSAAEKSAAMKALRAKGKPGRGSAWSVSSLYPVTGKPYPGIVSGHAPTLPDAVREFLKAL